MFLLLSVIEYCALPLRRLSRSMAALALVDLILISFNTTFQAFISPHKKYSL